MSFSRLMLAGGTALMLNFPANAQSMPPMDHGSMPGMPMPKKPAKQPPKPSGEKSGHGTEHKPESDPGSVSPAAECTAEHARMGHCTPAADPAEPAKPTEAGADDGMAGMVMEGQPTGASPSDPDCPPEHAKMGHCTPKAASPVSAVQSQSALGTDLEPGNAPAPSPPSSWYADRLHSPTEMARARDAMMKEAGGTTVAFASFDLAEYVKNKLEMKGQETAPQAIDEVETQSRCSTLIAPKKRKLRRRPKHQPTGGAAMAVATCARTSGPR